MNRNRLVVSKTAIKQYSLIFIFMIMHGNRLMTIYNDYILIFVLALGLLTICSTPSVIGSRNINYLVLLSAVLFGTSILTLGSLMPTTVLALLSRFIIAFLVVGVDRDSFVERFIKFVFVIACISIAGYIITQVSPGFLKAILPQYTYYYISPWSGQAIARPTYYAGLFQFRGDHDITRNIGMFNEPGLYQIVLNTALYFMLFARQKCGLSKKKWKTYLIVFCITLLTTQSATGYIGLIILCMGYVFAEKKEYRWKAMLALICVIVFVITYLYFEGTESWLYQRVLRKIISEDGSFDLMGSTGKSRVISMIADMKIFLQNPFGNGTKQYESLWSSYLTETITDTSSPVGMTSSLAIYGVISVGMIWWFYFHNKWNNKSSFIDWIICIALIINTTLAQPSIFFPCFIVMSLVSGSIEYGYNEGRYING